MSYYRPFHPKYHKNVTGLVEVTLGEHLLIRKMLVRHQHLVNVSPTSSKYAKTPHTNSLHVF